MTKTKRGIPPLSKEELLKCPLEELEERERLLRERFKRVKADDSLDMVAKLRKLRTIKSAVGDCAWAIKAKTTVTIREVYKELIPTLKYLRLYMDELAESLDDLKDDLQIPVTYIIRCPEEDNINGQTLIDGYLSNFKIAILQNDSREPNLQYDFSLRFQCCKEDNPDIHLFAFREMGAPGIRVRTGLEKLLRDYNLKFDFSEQACTGGTTLKFRFDIKPVVNVELKFEGNPKTKTIDLTIQNGWGLGKKGEFGTVKLYGIPSEIKKNGANAIEALIRTVMRYPSRLFEFFDRIEENQVATIPEPIVGKKTTFKKANVTEILDRIQDDNQQIKTDYQEIKTAQQKTNKSIEKLEKTVKGEHAKTREVTTLLAEEQQKQNATVFGWLFTALFNRKDGRM